MSVSTAPRRPPMHHNHSLLPHPNTSARRQSRAHNDNLSASKRPNPSKPVAPSLFRGQNGHAASAVSITASSDSLSEVSPLKGGASQLPDLGKGANGVITAKRTRGPPDWDLFYKNGLPKEVIVIEDTPETETGEICGPPGGDGAQELSSGVDDSGKYENGLTQFQPPGTVRPSDLSRDPQRSSRTSLEQSSRGPEPAMKRKRTASTAAEATQASQRNKRTKVQPADGADIYNSLTLWQHPEYKGLTHMIQRTRKNVHLRPGTVDPAEPITDIKDQDGHYIVVPKAHITPRYEIRRLLGQGTFGKVVEAYDKTRGDRVALKVIRAVQKYRDAAKVELRVLQTLRRNDNSNRHKCIHLRDCFEFNGHTCLVMDLLGSSLFDFLKANHFLPFPTSHIQSFAKQLLTSVAFLHDLGVIHTDLKPENILLQNQASEIFAYHGQIPKSSSGPARQPSRRKVLLCPEIRVIDFGSAVFQDEYHSSVVSTRHYRAPEIILGLGWSFPCDVWSIACILVEFWTGEALFQTHDNLEHLAIMEKVFGQRIDPELIKQVNKIASSSQRVTSASSYFQKNKLHWPATSTVRNAVKFVRGIKQLKDIIPPTSRWLLLFVDLLEKMFTYDPDKRITAREALHHDWFKEAIIDDGTEAARVALEMRR